MKDFIFIIGTSGVGKTTLGKGLFEHYQGAFVEQNMVPEFGIPENIDDEGIFEEMVCWESCVTQMIKFHEMGIKNIVCHDLSQLHDQMENRKDGLTDYDLQKKCSDKVNKRALLVNEVLIDVTNKTAEQVLDEAIRLIESTATLLEYHYEKPEKELFYSWVFSNELR